MSDADDQPGQAAGASETHTPAGFGAGGGTSAAEANKETAPTVKDALDGQEGGTGRATGATQDPHKQAKDAASAAGKTGDGAEDTKTEVEDSGKKVSDQEGGAKKEEGKFEPFVQVCLKCWPLHRIACDHVANLHPALFRSHLKFQMISRRKGAGTGSARASAVPRRRSL